MLFNPRSGSFSNIEPDIDTVGSKSCFQYFDAGLNQVGNLVIFLIGKFCEARDVPKGCDHEVTIVVRKLVHDDKSRLSPVQYKAVLVFAGI
jgi:hypothetical protein